MTRPLVVIGAGGFGREALDVAEAMNSASATPVFDILGVVDDNLTEENRARLHQRGAAYLGTTEDWLASRPEARFVIGVGAPATRRRIDERLRAVGLRAATLWHPAATRGSQVTVGEGTIVCAGVRLTNNIQIGRHVHLNLNVTVGHDTRVHDYVSVNPLVAISGDCTIGPEVMFGTGSVILQGLSVGAGATIGASACVVRGAAAGVTVKGVPAR